MGLFNGNQFPYTNFHEMNLDWLAERIEQAAGIADGLADRVTDAEAAINTLDQRVTTDDQLIAGNTSQIATHTSQIAEINQDITTLDSRVTTETSALDQRITTETNALDDRITTNSDDIDGLETRISTAESDIDTLETDVADKSTVEVEQILSGGVRVGTITVDGTPTTLYAPTAGSTVVRAEDVPFNNQGVTPAMTAIDCQEAIEELNTNNAATASTVGSMNTRLGTVETSLANLNAEDVTAAWPDQSETDLQSILDSLGTDTSQLRLITDNIERNMYYDNESTRPNRTNRVELANECFVGHTLSNSTKIAFFVPVSRQFNRAGINPVDYPDSYVPSIQGNLYVRGYNGYLLNNVSITGSQVTGVTVQFAEAGALITITLSAAVSISNGSMVEVSMSNNPILRWHKST